MRVKEYCIKYFITSIGDNVFKDCINLKYVAIPKTVRKIGKNAFSGCTGLFELKIPNKVTIIGENAFLGVKNVIYNGTATGSPWGAENILCDNKKNRMEEK